MSMEKTINDIRVELEEAMVYRDRLCSLHTENYPPHVKQSISSLLNQIDIWEQRLRARITMIQEAHIR